MIIELAVPGFGPGALWPEQLTNFPNGCMFGLALVKHG